MGSVPLAGRIAPRHDDLPACWVVAGLGARGLVYHALLGRWIASAVVQDDPLLLPPEVRSWQRHADNGNAVKRSRPNAP